MIVTVEMVTEKGVAEDFTYEASLYEQNEDTLDYVWLDLSDEELIVEMVDRAMQQVSCLFPDHKIMSTKFAW